MPTRKIVRIDEERCNGCGLCIPNCAEGALKIIEGKAKLISDKFCDGLGACLGYCPQDAITITEREAEDFDEKLVENHLHKKKDTKFVPESEPKPQPPSKPEPAPLFTPLESPAIYGGDDINKVSIPYRKGGVKAPSFLTGFTGCPSSRAMHFEVSKSRMEGSPEIPSTSMLSQWPVQLKLVPVDATYFQNADLLVVADCVPFAYPNFHRDFLKGKAMVVGCPKLDDIQFYKEKLTEIFKNNSIKSVTVPYVEVPCCFGLVKATEDAIAASGKKIPFKKVKIGIQGEIKSEH